MSDDSLVLDGSGFPGFVGCSESHLNLMILTTVACVCLLIPFTVNCVNQLRPQLNLHTIEKYSINDYRRPEGCKAGERRILPERTAHAKTP